MKNEEKQMQIQEESYKTRLKQISETRREIFESRMKIGNLDCTMLDYLNDVCYHISKSDALQKCSMDSIFDATMQACKHGLTIGYNKAHLVPYGDKATLQIGYEGFVELLKRVADIKIREEDIIRTGDTFTYGMKKQATEEGLKSIATYTFEKKALPGAAIEGAYCYIALEDGNSYLLYMDKVQIQRYRTTTQFWSKWEDKMILKTVIKELTKVLYKRYNCRSDILDIISRDETDELSSASETKPILNLTLTKPKTDEVKEIEKVEDLA